MSLTTRFRYVQTMVLGGVEFLEFGMHLKAYYSRAWGHGMHLKAYYSRAWGHKILSHLFLPLKTFRKKKVA